MITPLVHVKGKGLVPNPEYVPKRRAFTSHVDPPYVHPTPPDVPAAVAYPLPQETTPTKTRRDPHDRKTWSKLARVVAWLRVDADKGVGDTVARTLGWFGAKDLAEMYERIAGMSCGCEDRRVKLNEMFPYTLASG